ncbi:MAG TPA: phosphatidate cytidylyltransferase [Dehalococcoidia bacterium]|nr:phosphatidate cytidylyltransferase [Dehalococcoidia bacterium]
MLKQRIITAVIGLPLLVGIIWLGKPFFTLLIASMAVIGSFEFYRMAGYLKVQPLAYLGIASVLFIILAPHCPHPTATPLLITSVIVISLVWLLFKTPREQAFNNWAWTVAGMLYIGWMLSHWVSLRDLVYGRELVLWAMFTTFASDTSAFFCGRTWGKHSLMPAISPGKTWEGALGGLLTSIVASLLLGILFSLPFNYWQIILLGILISIFAQLGDLVESLLKRNTGAKDSSKLLPGHGGLLDRLDSLIFTGVVVYYCVILTKGVL